MKYENLLKRFLDYVKFETRSDENVDSVPTTLSQVEFGNKLIKEIEKYGVKDIHIAEGNYIIGTIPASEGYENVPVVDFMAHMDTADFNAKNINPQIYKNYNGDDIVINKELDIKLQTSIFPNLKKYIGKTLITTDGTTLLGGDDKAGVSEIVTMCETLFNNTQIKHGEIKIAFTPDEETGKGANLFNAKDFNAKFAYTVDGGPLGNLEYETFNAAGAKIKLNGFSVHPGYAKDKLVNASTLANEFYNELPLDEVPEKTEGYEGFYMVTSMQTTIDDGSINMIIRDHDKIKFEKRKQFIIDIIERLNNKHEKKRFEIEMKDQYYNMREILEKDMLAVDIAIKAMKNINIKPEVLPIRGGTDGSKISFMGIPTPNLFSGQENMHGKYEFVCLETMERAVDTIIEIIKLTANM